MLTFNGLRISKVCEGAEAEPGADLVWRVRRMRDISPLSTAGPWIGQAEAGENDGAVHDYGHDGQVRCRFHVNPDATEVDCLATPEVTDRDLHSLFVEPVMRTILARGGRLSFHAAALVRDGRAVLIAANKGAGKSTLSWALQQQGWRLFSDDLSCVSEIDGRWNVYPGHRQTKLSRDTAAALGHVGTELASRFDENPEDVAHIVGADKCVLPADTSPVAGAAPVAGFLFLNPRDPKASGIHSRPVTGVEKVALLVNHATRNPLTPGPGLSPGLQSALGRLAGHLPALTVTLPDSLERLADCAAAIDALVPHLAGVEGS